MKNFRIHFSMWVAPVVLLFYFDEKIALRDRLYYFVQTLLRSSPFLLLYSYFHAWEVAHEDFLLGVGAALLLSTVVGGIYHLQHHSFDLGLLLKKTARMMGVITLVYMLLALLQVPLQHSQSGELFERTIELMTLLYPVSKAIKHIFILTHGKYPPAWVIKALYNYEKEGKLKDFFNNN